jgi:hypothetical protein
MRFRLLPVLLLLLMASHAGAVSMRMTGGDQNGGTGESAAQGDTTDTSSERLTPDEYRYANTARYTVTGDLPFRQSHIQTIPLILTSTAAAGLVTAIHIYQYESWWKNQGGKFHSEIQWDYSAQLDKFGHMYAGYFTSYLAHEALITSGVSHDAAKWIAPLFGIAFTTYVEIEDGFAGGWGFDPTDQIANMTGATLYGAQQYIPWLQNVQMKWSYWPTPDPTVGQKAHNTTVIDNYNSTSMWFSLKMGNILPESIGWPKWLRLAVGYGAQNTNRMDENFQLLPAQRRIFIGLDYDLVELMPDLGPFGNWLVQTLDYIHLPAPALQIYPETRFSFFFPVTL